MLTNKIIVLFVYIIVEMLTSLNFINNYSVKQALIKLRLVTEGAYKIIRKFVGKIWKI